MSLLEYHILLALADGPLYGYAISTTVAADSHGAERPRAGSLYRIIARLTAGGFVREADPRGAVAAHPGLERRYYALTATGRKTLAAEAKRLKGAAALADRRLRPASDR